ncbi:hypothetical protein [Nonomuraea endophytica]|uniref:Uncharacterized protein n=1 Tax=Nonomuraea endophytica TaxID=714136 RepID=A0A7W7ZYR3_9ACTN|nr:hypothetical protein [Nonomuraea endophytica]MBB5075711.1 hypothetical protein [Nonomuraea endophytica]
MRVGYGSAELPVPNGTPMGGYIDRPGPSTGTLDPLRVSAVTWSDGERRFALAVADVICVNTDLAEYARQAVNLDEHAPRTTNQGTSATRPTRQDEPARRTADQDKPATWPMGQDEPAGRTAGESKPASTITPQDEHARRTAQDEPASATTARGGHAGRPAEVGDVEPVCELWLAASHTHAGPETGCVPGGGVTPGPWLERVSGAVRAAVHRAVDSERAADGTAHRGELLGVGADRSRPNAARTVPLDVVAVWGDSGLAGVVVVLPVHPTVLPASNLLVSADLAGAVRRALRARLGDGVWAVVATGAAGNVSTRFTRLGQDAAELDRLGGLVADRCVELLAQPGERAWTGTDQIRTVRARRDLRRAQTDADHGSLAADYATATATGDPVAARLARSRLEGVRARALGTPPFTDTIPVDVSVARVGSLGLVGLPGEPFLEVAERITNGLGPIAVLGYVNGYPGYLPTAEAYQRSDYEVLVSAVAPGSAETLADTARQLLEEA